MITDYLMERLAFFKKEKAETNQYIDFVQGMIDELSALIAKVSCDEPEHENCEQSSVILRKDKHSTGVLQLPSGKWQVRVQYRGERFYLGSFPTKKEAMERRKIFLTERI